MTRKHYIADLIALGNLKQAITALHEFTDANGQRSLHQDLTALLGRFSRNEHDKFTGTIAEADYALERNRITEALQHTVEQYDDHDEPFASPQEEIADYATISGKIRTNRGAGTTELLQHKTVNDLDINELARLFEQGRVKRELQDMGLDMAALTAHQKLVHLGLGENGHLFKGTFLCLGQRNQVQTVSQTAAESKFTLFKGTERSNILAMEDVRGNLLQQFERMMLHIQRFVPAARDRARNEDVYEIPLTAIREFVANAYVHRSYEDNVRSFIQVELYDDRLEIKSPGTLPEGLDLQHIEGTVLVNPTIMAVFHLYRLVEKSGTGINIAQRILTQNGLQKAVIDEIKSPKMIKTTIYRNKIISVNFKEFDIIAKILADAGSDREVIEKLFITANVLAQSRENSYSLLDIFNLARYNLSLHFKANDKIGVYNLIIPMKKITEYYFIDKQQEKLVSSLYQKIKEQAEYSQLVDEIAQLVAQPS